MVTYETLNTRLEGNEILVFFKFSNGEVNSHKFPLTSTIIEIQKWAVDRAKWFDERKLQIEEMRNQLVEPIEEITQE